MASRRAGPGASRRAGCRARRRRDDRMTDLGDFQRLIERMYSHKDRERGSAGTFLWLVEEIGELASAVGEGNAEDKAEEFADVMAWIATLANVEGVDLTEALEAKYGKGCPGCGRYICHCDEKP